MFSRENGIDTDVGGKKINRNVALWYKFVDLEKSQQALSLEAIL